MKKVIVRIANDVREVLRNAETAGNMVSLGKPGSLPVKLYKDTDKVLQALGFKWSKKAGGHVNESVTDARASLDGALKGDEVVDEVKTKTKALQFYPTNPALAARLMSVADVEGYVVLEPSAGRGALIRAALDAGAESVDAVEIDQRMAVELAARYNSSPVTIVGSNFLTIVGGGLVRHSYSRIVANPPFNNGQCYAHVDRMIQFLAVGGTATVLVPANFWTNRSDWTLGSSGYLLTHDEEVGVDKQSGSAVPLRVIQITHRA